MVVWSVHRSSLDGKIRTSIGVLHGAAVSATSVPVSGNIFVVRIVAYDIFCNPCDTSLSFVYSN